jgi:predicted lipoprotein with Yx(FWY)xxD motif
VSRIHLSIAALALAVVMAVTGCGGSSSSSGNGEGGAYGGGESTATSKPANSGSSEPAASISVSNLGGEVGKALVDSEGFTLYYFEKDKRGESACYGACAKTWPPLATGGGPKATGGAMAAKLGTTKRSDGTVQVTYAGWPLYTYEADRKPGEANGADVDSFGAEWYALHPNGEKAG